MILSRQLSSMPTKKYILKLYPTGLNFYIKGHSSYWRTSNILNMGEVNLKSNQ